MAGESGAPAPDIAADLARDGRAYGFFQAMRLLRLCDRGRAGTGPDARVAIRVRPNLALKFPETDLEAIERGPGDRLQVTANFLGLYGTSSPLPTFYTEELMEEARNDRHASRDFLDLLNHRLYPLLFEAWSRARPMIEVVEQRDHRFIGILFILIGLGEPILRNGIASPRRLLRYIGLLTMNPRSALAMETLLSDALGNLPVEVVSCRPARVRIPIDQRIRLGTYANLLGADAFVGEETADRSGAITIRIGPLAYERFARLLPDGPDYRLMEFFVRFYPSVPADAEVELILEPSSARPACLGDANYARLGLDTWLFGDDSEGERRAAFWLRRCAQ
jgi:type VI secretion system protein ImpH